MTSPKVQAFAFAVYSEHNYDDDDKPYIDVTEDNTSVSVIYNLSLWDRTLLEKLIVTWLFKHFPEL